MKPGWLPPVSPQGLIQETLWPNEWLILVSCILLNQTQRKQVERVWPEFVRRWPTPQAFMEASNDDVAQVIRPLGFGNCRTKNLRDMTTRYLCGPWEHVRELPGIGEYGARSWEIFCQGIVGDEPPRDHALLEYWVWLKTQQPFVRHSVKQHPSPW